MKEYKIVLTERDLEELHGSYQAVEEVVADILVQAENQGYKFEGSKNEKTQSDSKH